MRFKSRSEQGNVTIVALIILVVLTLIGITVSRTSTIDIQVAGNQIPYKQEFYVTEGGVNTETSLIGSGGYVVTDINTTGLIASRDGETSNVTTLGGGGNLPGGGSANHNVLGESYDFEIDYLGYYLPPAGYSTIDFSRYDFDVDVTHENTRILTRNYKIGPKAE